MKITYRTDAERRQHCKAQGVDPQQHCCLDMAWFISDPVEEQSLGANPVILWISSWNEYRIHLTREGNSSTLIRHCPWCGAKLPESKADLWYETLVNLGFHDPGNDDIPKEYESDRWWRNTSA